MSTAAVRALTNIVAANIAAAACVVVTVVAAATGAVSGDIRRASASSHDSSCITQYTHFHNLVAAAAS